MRDGRALLATEHFSTVPADKAVILPIDFLFLDYLLDGPSCGRSVAHFVSSDGLDSIDPRYLQTELIAHPATEVTELVEVFCSFSSPSFFWVEGEVFTLFLFDEVSD